MTMNQIFTYYRSAVGLVYCGNFDIKSLFRQEMLFLTLKEVLLVKRTI